MSESDWKRVLGKIKSSAAIKYILAGFVICVGVWRIYHQTLSYVTGYDPMLVAEVVRDGGALSSPGQMKHICAHRLSLHTSTSSALVRRQRAHDGCAQSLFKRPIGGLTCEFVIEPVKISIFGRRIGSPIDAPF